MPFKCTKCDKYFKSKYNLEKHEIKKISCHLIKKKLECKLCNIIFERKAHQEKHEKTQKHKTNSGIVKNTEFKVLNNDKIEEFIYILTNKHKEQKSIYKIGRTCNLKSRLSAYNTGCMDSEIHHYKAYYNCINANQLEQLLLSSLSKFTIRNEIVQINYELLDNIIKSTCEHMKNINNLIDN